MDIPEPKRDDVKTGSYALVMFSEGEAVYQFERPVDWKDPRWILKDQFEHDEVPALDLEEATLRREHNGDGLESVTVYAEELSSSAGVSGEPEAGGSVEEGSPTASGYRIQFDDGQTIPKTGTHQQQKENMFEAVAYLDETYDLAEKVEIPYAPGFARKNVSLNDVPEHPDGREMRGAEELPSGVYLYTGMNKQEKQDRIRNLANQVGIDVEFHGDWDE
jgi:hypothetical protein